MKFKMYYLAYLCLLISWTLLSGCLQFPRSYDTFHLVGSTPVRDHGISPIYPAMNYGFVERYRTIDTLTPELKWKDVKTVNQTYDVCIWETPYRSIKDVERKADQVHSSWGTVVFSTNNIPTNSCQITFKLKPDTYYNWSVRIQDGEKERRWSSFTQQTSVLNVTTTYSDEPFGFKTPMQ